MEPASWRAARELFEALVELGEEERARRLAGCAPELATVVREMLELDRRAGARSFLAAADRPAAPHEPRALEGSSIGPFRVLRPIGRGGMGVVYEAEQASPRRRVALKVLRPELVGSSLLRRFQVEAEVLASLRHPGIARVLASGTHEMGSGALRVELHWQALELLEDAHPLTSWAAERRLDARECAASMVQVADAVQHAHERGVIHRDLKPANVLVDATGRPRVIDFGVARAASEGEVGRMTAPGELVGTLRYMAPEQLAGDPAAVDVRVDVYALGVMLYELLCGRPPIEIDGLTHTAALRALVESEPERPRALRPGLARELEWIVLSALERDPRRRTASAAALRDDLARYLDGAPVEAGSPGRLYRLRKLAWRHRLPLAAGALVVASLSAGLVVALRALGDARAAQEETALALGRESEARRAAELEGMKSTNVIELVEYALEEARRAGGVRDLRVSELFVDVSRALGSHGMLPEVEATVRNTIARFHLGLGNLGEALREAQEAEAALRRGGEEESLEAVVAATILGQAATLRGRYEEAEAGYERALRLSAAHRRPYPIDGFLLRQRRIGLRIELGRLDDAQRELDELRAEIDAVYGASSQNAWAVRGTSVSLRLARGDLDGAEGPAEQYLTWSRGAGSEDFTVAALELLGRVRVAQERFAEAAALFEEALELADRRGGRGNLHSARCAGQLARAWVALGRVEEAVPLAERSLAELREQEIGGAMWIAGLRALAEARLARGDVEEALASFEEGEAIVRASLPPTAPARVAWEAGADRFRALAAARR